MKKLIAVLLLACLLPLWALAEMDENGGVTVALDGVEVFFMPMEGSICLTRESSASVFNRLGLSQREVLSWMTEASVYALMFDRALTCEIYVAAWPTDVESMADMTDHDIMMMCSYVRDDYVEADRAVDGVKLYSVADGHKFIRTISSNSDAEGTEYMIEYLTYHGGYEVQIILFPYDGAAVEAVAVLGAEIADSMRITADAISLDGQVKDN